MDTIFDKIISKEIPADIVYEDDTVLAFKDINPQAPIHVLVIPKKRVDSYSQLKNWDASDVGDLFKKASLIASKLGLDENGYRIVVNNGKHGQQSVDYLHVHIVGGRMFKWPPG